MSGKDGYPNARPRFTGFGEFLVGGELLRPARAFGKSILVVAGPWILAVLVLALITAALEPVMGRAATEDLRLTIIYALCIAPLTAAPISAITSWLIRAAIEEDEAELVPEYFVSALVLSGALTLVIAFALTRFLGVSTIGMTLAFIFLSVVTALLWTCLSILSSMKAYAFLMAAFASGLTLSLFAAMLTVDVVVDLPRLIWAFSSGLALTVALVLARLVDASHGRSEDLLAGMARVLQGLSRQRYLALGTLLAFCGVWADKWIFWAGPTGEQSLSGFHHFGTYDSVMFVAHLSIIPTFAAMYNMHEGEFTSSIKRVRQTLNRKANLDAVQGSVGAFGARAWNGIFMIFYVQATITATLVLIAPIISQLMSFDFSQFLMLRVGLVAVFLHSIFYASSAVLVICGRHRLFFLVHLAFLVLNSGLTLASSLTIGPSAFGISAASLLAALLAFAVAYRSVQRFDYLYLVGENDALFDRQ